MNECHCTTIWSSGLPFLYIVFLISTATYNITCSCHSFLLLQIWMVHYLLYDMIWILKKQAQVFVDMPNLPGCSKAGKLFIFHSLILLIYLYLYLYIERYINTYFVAFSAIYQLNLVKAETARAFIPKGLRLVEAFGYAFSFCTFFSTLKS